MEVALVWIVVVICASGVAIAGIIARQERDKEKVAPQELLAQRYAAGEIDETEYLTRLSILKDANELTS